MINNDKFVVCDLTKIILNDGVTIFDGYVELHPDGKLYMHISEDPNNASPKPGILKYRLVDESKTPLVRREGIAGFGYIKTDVIRHFTGTGELIIWWKNEEYTLAQAQLKAEELAKSLTKKPVSKKRRKNA